MIYERNEQRIDGGIDGRIDGGIEQKYEMMK